MVACFERLFEETRPAFLQERTFQRARTLAMSSLVGLGRRTVTGMLCTSAQQFADWSAAYRLFERQRFDTEALFVPARREVIRRLRDEDLVVVMDDTLVRKRGKKIPGTGWKRDPLGPPFCTNFVWGQRFLQISAALPDTDTIGRARGIPIDITHAPSPVKPRRTAPKESWDDYRILQQTMKVSAVGLQRLVRLRQQLDHTRRLIVSVDGGFTNRTIFRDLPEDTIAIGRIRKDAKLYYPPETACRRGRQRWYGTSLQTPEEIRKDEAFPWQTVKAFAAGTTHSFEVKTVGPVRWVGTGPANARLVVIKPLAYRPKKGARLLYREPVYLLCTDCSLPLEKLLQSYLWRWEVELNFRDEKTVIGVGEAQVRSRTAAESVPAFIVAAYAFLLLTADGADDLPQPKWRKQDSADRLSTARMLGMMRSQLWGKAMGVYLPDFVRRKDSATNPVLFEKSLPDAVCYAFR
jgi:hypothetical protein